MAQRFALSVVACTLAAVTLARMQPAPPPIEPTLLTTIDIRAAGGGARVLFGDVTGDGRLEIVMMQPGCFSSDTTQNNQVQALTAYDLEGHLLWQVGTPDPRVTGNGTDIPAQIYDIDGDGLNEVVAVMNTDPLTLPCGAADSKPQMLSVFDGRTGQLARAIPLPPTFHDALMFANLRGTDLPRDIVVKDRYQRVLALDDQGNLLWTRASNTGHYPWPHDFDGDGRQEIMIGDDLVRPDGTLIWTWPNGAGGHTDSMWMTDLTGDGRTDIVRTADAGGVRAAEFNGNRLWTATELREAQNVMCGVLRSDFPSPQCVGLDRINRSDVNGIDALFLLSAAGQIIWKEDRGTPFGCWRSIPEMIHNWDGQYTDLVMAWNRGCGVLPSIFDGYGNVISAFHVDGRMWHNDLCGDDREEVVNFVMGDKLHIYANGPCGLQDHITGRPRPQRKRDYNFTRYTAGETPEDVSTGRPATATTWECGYPVAQGNDGHASTGWRTGRVGESWLVDLGRLYTVTGSRVMFPGPGTYRYRVEASRDGSDWVVVDDRTTNSSADALQRRNYTAVARYVRFTVTGVSDVLGFDELVVYSTEAKNPAPGTLATPACTDTTPPVLSLPPPVTVEATGPAGAVAMFAASAVDSADGPVPVTFSHAPGSVFPLGTTGVTVTATDAAGNSATGTVTVTVVDTTPPAIERLTASPATLWGPNHQMVAVTIDASTSDIADPSPSARIVAASSTEAESGLWDGDTGPDWAITGPLTLNLRAERAGAGRGRTYTITVESRDRAGNAATSTVTVFVPHDMKS